MTKLTNILRHSLNPRYFPVMLTKVRRRLERNSSDSARDWAQAHAISIKDYCESINSKLWRDTVNACESITKDAQEVLNSIPHDLGGGGAYPLLHFLVSLTKPDTVVETGVAAGWSSRAILEAITQNRCGKLYSSDFPYFRIKNPEKYVGVVVQPELRFNWTLDLRGDAIALPIIVEKVDKIDIFHYDSDKSYAGRKYAMEIVQGRLQPSSIVVMDDIQDNLFFRDYVTESNVEFTVFEFNGKFLGATGLHNLTLSS